MANASPLKHIDETFCLCSICLEQFKEPKLLSCFHRFCKECLKTLTKANTDTLRCPECREEIQIPSSGEFKTDFYMKNLVEYVQIQRSLQSDEMRECYGCSKHLRVTAYCFKCNDFLCEDCQNFHLTNKFLKDHQKHTLSLKDVESKNITMEKLASMRDAPSCHSHPEKVSELYCETCDNLPVCMACTYGEHKGHDLHEVKALGKSKRELLAQKLKCLEKLDEDYQLALLEQAKEKVISNVNNEKEKLIKISADEVRKTKIKLLDMIERQAKIKQEKENREKEAFNSLQVEMEKEVQGIKKKYEDRFEIKKNDISDTFRDRESFVENEVAKLNGKLESFDRDRNVLLESIEMQRDKNIEDIQAISEHFDKTKNRFENFKVLASTFIASENDWIAVECIPDMNIAADNLMKDFKHDLPDLDTLTGVTINYNQSSLRKSSMSKISEQVETKITLDDTYYHINGVTRSGDGYIVISGCPFKGKEAFIIVADVNFKKIQQKKINSGKQKPWHACDFLSQNKVATVCEPNIIGVYDVLRGSYITKCISDIIDSWPKGRLVRCVATDPVNNHILVGGKDSRDVYVFDDQLKYLHILTLPEMIKWPKDMSVCNGHLLVCDFDQKKSYVTAMEKLTITVIDEFVKLDLEGNNYVPWSVCTDKNGMVYMLWMDEIAGQYYLVQYINDGRKVTAKRRLDDKACALAAIETSHGEKLIVATHKTQTLYSFGLLDED